MSQLLHRGRQLIVIAAIALFSGPAWAQQENGIAPNQQLGPILTGPVLIDDLLWTQFAFTTIGAPITGCAPADPAGPGCVASSAGNSQFGDAPPWTFTAAGPVTLTVVDCFLIGDRFEIFDGGTSMGFTSVPGAGPSAGSDPANCFFNPAISAGTFPLGPGSHSITIGLTASPFTAGAAYFRVDSDAAPPVGYYVLDAFGGVHAGGGAPVLLPATPYFGFNVAQDLELRR